MHYTYQTEQIVFTHHKSKTEQNKNYGTNAKIHQVFHYDITSILRTGKTGFDHCKTRLHKEYKSSSYQEPYTI